MQSKIQDLVSNFPISSITNLKKAQKARVVRINLKINEKYQNNDEADLKMNELLLKNRQLKEENLKLHEKLNEICENHHELLEENEKLRKYEDSPIKMISYNEVIEKNNENSGLFSIALSLKNEISRNDIEEVKCLLIETSQKEPTKFTNSYLTLSIEKPIPTEEEICGRLQQPRIFEVRKRPEIGGEAYIQGKILDEKSSTNSKEYEELQSSIKYEILKRASCEQGKNGEIENPEVNYGTDTAPGPFNVSV